MNEQTSEMGVGGKLLVLSGSVLIIAGVVVLLFIAQLIYQLFYEPDQIYLIKYLMDTIDLSDKAFFGRIDNAPFYIHVSDPIKYFLYLMGIAVYDSENVVLDNCQTNSNHLNELIDGPYLAELAGIHVDEYFSGSDVIVVKNCQSNFNRNNIL